MEKSKVLKYVIPVIAVLVLGESVLLISKLGGKTQVMPAKKSDTGNVPMVTSGDEKKLGVYNLEVTADNKNIKLGKTATVEVKMRGSSARALDVANVYLKYDSAAFDASNLTFDKKLPKPTFSKVSTLRNMVVANFLVTDQGGFKLESGEEVTLMKFSVTPKMTGSFDFEISTGDELKQSVTMIVENATGTVLPFSSNKLTINVSR